MKFLFSLVNIFFLFCINFANVFASDIMRMHNYVSDAQSGYTSLDESDEVMEKSINVYKILNTRGGVNLEQEVANEVQHQQYTPIIKGSLNKFYQQNGMQPVLFAEENIAKNLIKDEQKPLHHYVSFFIGKPLSINMKTTQSGITTNLSGLNQIYQGIAGLYFGRIFTSLPFMRFEYGGQYEVLSFTEETTLQYNSIRNHSGTASVRTFIDVPVFQNLAFSVGGEAGIGLFQQFYNSTTVRTFGKSYALLAGFTFSLSYTKSLYIMGRYGVIPSTNLTLNNIEKNVDLNSMGIIAGMQFFFN